MSNYSKEYEIAGQEISVVRHGKGDFEAYCEVGGFVSSRYTKQKTATTKEALKALVKSLEDEIQSLRQMQKEITWLIK